MTSGRKNNIDILEGLVSQSLLRLSTTSRSSTAEKIDEILSADHVDPLTSGEPLGNSSPEVLPIKTSTKKKYVDIDLAEISSQISFYLLSGINISISKTTVKDSHEEALRTQICAELMKFGKIEFRSDATGNHLVFLKDSHTFPTELSFEEKPEGAANKTGPSVFLGLKYTREKKTVSTAVNDLEQVIVQGLAIDKKNASMLTVDYLAKYGATAVGDDIAALSGQLSGKKNYEVKLCLSKINSGGALMSAAIKIKSFLLKCKIGKGLPQHFSESTLSKEGARALKLIGVSDWEDAPSKDRTKSRQDSFFNLIYYSGEELESKGGWLSVLAKDLSRYVFEASCAEWLGEALVSEEEVGAKVRSFFLALAELDCESFLMIAHKYPEQFPGAAEAFLQLK